VTKGVQAYTSDAQLITDRFYMRTHKPLQVNGAVVDAGKYPIVRLGAGIVLKKII
jgi:hypothetical protein